ncbi:MAG: hypothetical protein ACXVIF_01090 [Halobacteriota archaeon]
MMLTEMDGKKTFHSCESVDDVIFDLNGERLMGLGWVVFEIDDEKQRQANGVIGFSNNIFALKLLRHLNAQQPLRIIGYFSDSVKQGADSYALDDVTMSGSLLDDSIGFILFNAIALEIETTK